MPSNLSNNPSNPSDPSSVETEAADWFARREQGLSADEEAEFAAWLAADPRRVEIFRELEETWKWLGDASPPPLEAVPAAGRPMLGLRWALPLAAAAAVALVWVVGYHRYEGPHVSTATVFTESAATKVGEQRRLTLPDGSILRINTDSALEVRMTDAERSIRLTRGEVQFEVAHNPSRPFVVSVDGVDVHDVGTVFDVRLRPESVDILVTQGQVSVVDAAGTQSLAAGERAMIPRGGASAVPGIAKVDPAAAERLLSWRENHLEFDGEPLGDIVAEFNRYNRHKLVVVDPALAAKTFSGAFPSNDYAGLVKLLRNTFGVETEERPNETLLRSAL